MGFGGTLITLLCVVWVNGSLARHAGIRALVVLPLAAGFVIALVCLVVVLTVQHTRAVLHKMKEAGRPEATFLPGTAPDNSPDPGPDKDE